MWRRGVASVAGIVLLLFLCGAGQAVLNVDTGESFATIQAAIDDPGTMDGHTIEVESGTYAEQVNLTKAIVLVGSDTGGGLPVVDAGGSGNAIWVRADNATVDSLEVVNADVGVQVNGNGNLVANITANGNGDGIRVMNSGGNTVRWCDARESSYYGITLGTGANGNTVSFCVAEGNSAGFFLYSATDNTLYLNDVIGGVQSDLSTGTRWFSPAELAYEYDGASFTNYLGNYWGPVSITDADGNGIGDSPYSSGTVTDEYPLVAPFRDYSIGSALPQQSTVRLQQGLPLHIGIVFMPREQAEG